MPQESHNAPAAVFGVGAAGQIFIDWLLLSEGQQAIADYKLDGQQLFFPNGQKTGS